jgi:HD-GYP domain-containing protein (c-di-GMP phosphodiesterase class II)
LGDKEKIIKKLTQDINTRFLISAVGCILLVFFWFLGELKNLWPPVFAVLIGVTAVNSIIYFLTKYQKVNEATEYVVSIFDIALITYGVGITGGIKSPFYLFYVLIILIEGLHSNSNHVKYNLMMSLLAYSGLIVGSNSGVLTKDMVILLVSRLIFFFLTAGVSIYYIRIVLMQKTQLEHVTAERTRLYNQIKNFNEELEERIQAVTDELHDKIDEIQHLFVNTVKALSSAIVAKDPYTREHNERILEFTLAILDELKESSKFDFNYDEVRGTLQLAALLHDIGKIGIPDNILQKPGALTPEEWEIIKKHPAKGVSILEPIKELKEVAKVVLHHHERYDGKGYLDGLKGDQIPLLSRIIAIADTFDAMTSDRPYRKRTADQDAVEEIKRCSGSQFDPVLVEAFVTAHGKGKIKSQ